MKRKIMRHHVHEAIIRKHNGETYTAIAKDFGCADSTLARAIGNKHLPNHHVQQAWNFERSCEIVLAAWQARKAK